MRKKWMLLTLFFAVMVFSGGAQAATVVGEIKTGDYWATGIIGLSVGEVTYDVYFRRGPYNVLWPDGGYDVPDNITAYSVRNAINDALNANYQYVRVVSEDLSYGRFIYEIPYSTSLYNTNVWTAVGVNNIGNGPWQASSDNLTGPGEVNKIYARLQVIPIPGAVWLLASGLAGLALYRRKVKGAKSN